MQGRRNDAIQQGVQNFALNMQGGVQSQLGQIGNSFFQTRQLDQGQQQVDNQANQSLAEIGSNMGAGTAGLAWWLSDINAKENVEWVSISDEGLPIVEFNYIGDDQRWRGVIAQDVEKLIPDAVMEQDGIKYVDYSKLSVKPERV